MGFVVSENLFYFFGCFVEDIHLFHSLVESRGEHDQCSLGFGIGFFRGAAGVLAGGFLQIPSGTEQKQKAGGYASYPLQMEGASFLVPSVDGLRLAIFHSFGHGRCLELQEHLLLGQQVGGNFFVEEEILQHPFLGLGGLCVVITLQQCFYVVIVFHSS